MKEKKFRYKLSCVDCPNPDALLTMIDKNREITWEVFRRHCNLEDIKDLFPNYIYTGKRLGCGNYHIKDDYAVSFHKSKYMGNRCYYLRHSSIEYVFLVPEKTILDGEE